MANRNAPNGFRVAMHFAGGTPGRLNRYTILAGYTSALYTGDAVIPVNTSKQIARPGAGTARMQGVMDGVYYVLADGTPKFDRYWPASQTVQTNSIPEALVYDDPATVFQIQADGAFALADIGAFADYTLDAGNPLTGQSGFQLSSSSIGSGTSLKILDIVKSPDNDFGTNAKVLVSSAIHYMRGAQTAI